MDRQDILLKLHAYTSADGRLDTWKSKEVRGNNVRIRPRFRIKFYNQEEKLIKDFIDSAKELFDYEKYIYYSKKRGEIEVKSQILSKELLSLGDVSTSNWEMPQNLSENQKAIWIMAFADCDGSVGNYGYNKYVVIDSINLNGLKQISQALSELKISNRIQKIVYKSVISYRLKISDRKSVLMFSQIIGFNHPKKQEKLSEALNSYKRAS